MRVGVHQVFFTQIGFELIIVTSPSYFQKTRHRRLKSYALVCFLILNHKMPQSNWLGDKNYYDVILIKYWPKNAHILESDFEKL